MNNLIGDVVPGQTVWVVDFSNNFHKALVWEVKNGRIGVVSEEGFAALSLGKDNRVPIFFAPEDVRVVAPDIMDAA